MKLVGIGQSHIACVRAAAVARHAVLDHGDIRLATVLLNEPKFKPWRERCSDGGLEGWRLVDALRDAIMSALDGATLTFSCLGGNAHNILGLVECPQPFDFVLSEDPSIRLGAGRQIVPENIVRAALLDGGRGNSAAWFLRAVRQLVEGDFVHLESPPPIPSEAHIRRFASLFKAEIAAHGVAPAELRYKLWRLYSGSVREHCSEIGVRFINVPPETLGADGYLIEEAWHADPVHANLWYGQRVIEQLVRLKDPSFRFPEAA